VKRTINNCFGLMQYFDANQTSDLTYNTNKDKEKNIKKVKKKA
jgi:hypothetical protein